MTRRGQSGFVVKAVRKEAYGQHAELYKHAARQLGSNFPEWQQVPRGRGLVSQVENQRYIHGRSGTSS